MADVRHIVIAVDASDPPTIDITGFTVFEAYQILCCAADRIWESLPECRILGVGNESD